MINVELIGKFYDNHSLSIINRNLVLLLGKNTNYNITINPLDSITDTCTISKNTLKTLKAFERRDIGDIDIQIRHFYPPIWRWPVSDKTKIIYIQGWEFSRVPFEWQYKFETFADHVVTYSNWSRERFLESGLRPTKISAINPGYDPAVFNTTARPSREGRKFTFTYVGCGQYRKGLDILIEAYKNTFTKADPIKLVIKDTPGVYGESNLLSELLRLQYISDVAEIDFIDDDLTDKAIADLYRNTDIVVHPYRGEGFGMHIQEAMACGAFPLVTGTGSTDDFVNEDCGLRVNASKKFINLADPKIFAIKPGDSLTNMGSHAWIIEPDVKDLANKMRFFFLHHEKETILSKVSNAKLTTWELMATQYQKIIDTINEDISKPARLR